MLRLMAIVLLVFVRTALVWTHAEPAVRVHSPSPLYKNIGPKRILDKEHLSEPNSRTSSLLKSVAIAFLSPAITKIL